MYGYLIGPIIIFGFVFVFLSFFIFSLAKFLSKFSNLLVHILVLLTKFFSKIPISKIYIITPSFFVIIIYYFSVIIINFLFKIYSTDNKKTVFMNYNINTYKRIRNLVALVKYRVRENKDKIKKILIIFMIIIIVIKPILLFSKDLRIYFVDVGQRRLHFYSY